MTQRMRICGVVLVALLEVEFGKLARRTVFVFSS